LLRFLIFQVSGVVCFQTEGDLADGVLGYGFAALGDLPFAFFFIIFIFMAIMFIESPRLCAALNSSTESVPKSIKILFEFCMNRCAASGEHCCCPV
jgi:hypothetical protein